MSERSKVPTAKILDAQGNELMAVRKIEQDGSTLVIEVDGVQHDTPEARWADADRDAALTAAGVLVLRIPAFAVRRDPARVQARLSAINKAAQARAAQR